MKTTKKIAIVIIALAAVGLLVFAFIKLQIPRRIKLLHPSEETIRKDVTDYLQERYQEDFIITNILFPGFNYASYIITAYPVGAPQQANYKVTIHGWENKGLIDYYDNYPVVKLKPELVEYISNIVKDYFPEHKIYIQNFHKEWIRENIDKELTLDEFLSDKEGEWYSSGFYIICIPYGDWDDDELLNTSNEMIACMAENDLSGSYFIDVMYKNYDSLSDDYDKLELGKNGKDFNNYDFYISRSGEFRKATEVRTHGIK